MASPVCSYFISKVPIVVVLGATGTGKSKLAVELALKFKGEVISADSMQVYKGLDIVTNKVTAQEQMGIQHHLLGFLDPMGKCLLVPEFRNMALSIINDIMEREKLPIIVGGTNYYIESVLYNMLIDRPEVKTDENVREDDSTKKPKLYDEDEFFTSVRELDNKSIHNRLKEIDPEMADVLHPNNRRKIIRCLQVYHQHNETLSSLLKKQRSAPGGCDTGGPLRFTNSILFWLQCDSEVLKKRLDARVDAMISRGLVDELLQFKEKFDRENSPENSSLRDHTKGILQTIGFKEFKDYLSLDEESRKGDSGMKSLQNGIELLKMATKQYAKRQCKWIKNRFLENSSRQVPPIYGLDATDPSEWEKNVYEKAVHILECHLAGTKPSLEPLPVGNARIPVDKSYFCETCDRILVGGVHWMEHLRGKKHNRNVKKKRKSTAANEKPETLQECPATDS